MKYIYLINSFSVRDNREEVIKKLEMMSKKLKLDYEIRINSSKLSTEKILKEYKDSKNVIVSLGGDGTINRIVNSIYGTNNYLSFLPLGTGNDYAKSVNEQLKKGINKVDLVKINKAYFINLVCFGIDADIANDESFVNSKIIPRSCRYIASIFTNFFHFKLKHMKITCNDQVYESDYTTVAVCNGKYYGRGFIMGPRAKINDGIIDLYLIDGMGKLALIKTILKLKKGKHESSSKITSYQTKKIVIESDKNIACNYDGEKMISKKFVIKVEPKALNLYYDPKMQEEFAKIK